MNTVTDRTNLFAKACGALSLAAALLTAGFPCHVLHWIDPAETAQGSACARAAHDAPFTHP